MILNRFTRQRKCDRELSLKFDVYGRQRKNCRGKEDRVIFVEGPREGRGRGGTASQFPEVQQVGGRSNDTSSSVLVWALFQLN